LPQSEFYLPQPPQKHRAKVVFLLCLGLALILGLFIFTRSGRGEQTMDPLAYDPVTLEPKKPKSLMGKIGYVVFNRGSIRLAGEDEDRVNILLLGMGGPGHDGPYLTDTIMVASIKPSTKQVALISVPRDMAVNIPGYGTFKVNHANAFGEEKKPEWGAAFATEVISQTLDLPLHYYIRLDFKAFAEIIDEVGGVRVNVERSFTDPMFPAPKDEYQTVSFERGVQTMDGDTALTFARSRHGNNGEGSDFARARRQQKIILALKEKLLSFSTLINPVKTNHVLTSLENHLTTNLEFSQMMSLFKLAREMKTEQIISLVLDSGPGGYLRNTFGASGAFLLEPTAGNFRDINAAVKNIFTASAAQANDTPAQEKPSLPPNLVEIQNGTWNPGLAARLKKRLEGEGFIVGDIGNTTQKPVTQSGIYRAEEDASADVIRALVNELHIPERETPPSFITATSTTQVLIVLGDDFVD